MMRPVPTAPISWVSAARRRLLLWNSNLPLCGYTTKSGKSSANFYRVDAKRRFFEVDSTANGLSKVGTIPDSGYDAGGAGFNGI
jgi:hypothetical protein